MPKTASRQDKAGGVTDEELLRLARKAYELPVRARKCADTPAQKKCVA